MRDLFAWSLPLGRLFGITIKVHILFPFVVIPLILKVFFQKDVTPGTWIDASMLMALLFITVLLHELGHCAGARYAEGDAQEVLLWPLGGLAFVDVPHTPRANLITVLAGPAVNVLICLAAGLALFFFNDPHLRPPWNPLWYPYRYEESGTILLFNWDGSVHWVTALHSIVLARLFYVSWILFLFNIVIIGFPLDGGRIFQCILW
jgi:stage IV sporulation protein FB